MIFRRSGLLEKAHHFARKKHQGQKDDSGMDYFKAHICPVVSCLAMFNPDDEVLCAGYLHDTIEDTDTSYQQLVEEFGKRVADLVAEVTHEGDKTRGYIFPRLESREGIMIKLADRLSNISRMDSWSEDRKQHYLKRTKFWKSSFEE